MFEQYRNTDNSLKIKYRVEDHIEYHLVPTWTAVSSTATRATAPTADRGRYQPIDALIEK